MSKNTSVTLGNHFNQFVEEQLASGRYGSVSEIVRAGLRHLEEHETKHAALQAAITEGLEGGVAKDFSMKALLNRLDTE